MKNGVGSGTNKMAGIRFKSVTRWICMVAIMRFQRINKTNIQYENSACTVPAISLRNSNSFEFTHAKSRDAEGNKKYGVK